MLESSGPRRRALHTAIWFAISIAIAVAAFLANNFIVAGTLGSVIFMPLCAGIGAVFDRGAQGLVIGETITLAAWAVVMAIAMFLM